MKSTEQDLVCHQARPALYEPSRAGSIQLTVHSGCAALLSEKNHAGARQLLDHASAQVAFGPRASKSSLRYEGGILYSFKRVVPHTRIVSHCLHMIEMPAYSVTHSNVKIARRCDNSSWVGQCTTGRPQNKQAPQHAPPSRAADCNDLLRPATADETLQRRVQMVQRAASPRLPAEATAGGEALLRPCNRESCGDHEPSRTCGPCCARTASPTSGAHCKRMSVPLRYHFFNIMQSTTAGKHSF